MSTKILKSLMIGCCALALTACFGGSDQSGSGEGAAEEGGAGSGNLGGGTTGDPAGDPAIGSSETGDGDPGEGGHDGESGEDHPGEDDGTGEDQPGDEGTDGDTPAEHPECALECDAGFHCRIKRCPDGDKGGDGGMFVPVPAPVCVPEPYCAPNPPCGVEGVECHGLGECVDDPHDDCNPEMHEACKGVCVCEAREDCPEGTRFNDAPEVCDCVEGDRPGDGGGKGDGGDLGGGGAGHACGDNVCGDGQVCCNEKCGICAPIGFAPVDWCEKLTC